MSADYRIDIKTAAGVKVAEIIEFQSLTYTKRRNDPGICKFTINGNNTKIDDFEDDSQIEIWRRNTAPSIALDWYCDYYGMFRGEESSNGVTPIFTAVCPGQMAKIGDRIVAYPKNTLNRSLFSIKPVETILNTLAKYNLTSSGSTADGRIRLATVTGISVETDGVSGSSVDYACAGENLLTTMQKLAAQQQVCFDLVKTGANTWQWRFIDTIDVSDDVIFAIERDNVEKITFTRDRSKEKTVAIVGGKGEDLLRPYRERFGTNYNVSTNNREMEVNASSDSDIAILNAKGDVALKSVETIPDIQFVVKQAPNAYYGKHYNLNYQVTGRYQGTDYVQIVSEVTVSVNQDAKESINIKLEDI